MEARAHLRYARIAPRKVSVVLDLIRGQEVDKALAILQYTPKAASELLYKLVKRECSKPGAAPLRFSRISSATPSRCMTAASTFPFM